MTLLLRKISLIIYFLIFIVIRTPEIKAESEIPFSVAENLIVFTPKIHIESGEVCQGFRVAKTLVATSPSCVRVITKSSERDLVQVQDTYGNIIGRIANDEASRVDAIKPDLLIFIDNISENDSYFDTPLYTGDFISEQNTAYFLNEQGSITKKSVFLTHQTYSENRSVLTLKSAVNLPEGTPVFDAGGNLVCFSAFSDSCRALVPELTFHSRTLKMTADDAFIVSAIPYINLATIAGFASIFGVISFYSVLL